MTLPRRLMQLATIKAKSNGSATKDGGVISLLMLPQFEDLCKTREPLVEGENSSNKMYNFICEGRDFGLDEAILEKTILTLYAPRCKMKNGGSFTADWVKNIVKNAFEYAQNEPGNNTPQAVFGNTPDSIISNDKKQKSATTKSTSTKEKKKPQLVLLQKIIRELVVLWHNSQKEPYATVIHNGEKLHFAVAEKNFKLWLLQTFRTLHKDVPNSNAVAEAVYYATAIAILDGETCEPAMRYAGYNGVIYVDLHRAQFVEISPGGYCLIPESELPSSVRFVRPADALPLPIPALDAPPEDWLLLKNHLNVTEETWPLAQGWLINAVRPAHTANYPILVCTEESGAGKTTLVKRIRSLIDPNYLPFRRLPANIDHANSLVRTNHVIAFNNISGTLTPEWSDFICGLSDGSGDGKRKHYENTDEVTIKAVRPTLINGIDNIISRDDALNRTVFIKLKRITSRTRKDDADLDREFERIYPRVLGALYSSASCALKNLPDVHLAEPPRMAGFARWCTAAEPALGLKAGEFMKAYSLNNKEAAALTLENSPFAQFLLNFSLQLPWEGSASALMKCAQLNSSTNWRYLPQTPNSVSSHLRRLAPALLQNGIKIEHLTRTGNERPIRILRVEADGKELPADPPAPEGFSPPPENLTVRDLL